MTHAKKHIAITGASSGLGAALAQAYAEPGVLLSLSGRSEERLEAVAALCRHAGAEVVITSADVTNKDAMNRWIIAADSVQAIDLLIANAGISGGTGGIAEPDEQARAIFAVNVDGVLNTVQPVIPRMVSRGEGQIALISSLAGMRGLPSAPAYSGSKAAVRVYGEALRGSLGKHGIKVSVVCPGYIRTPMTEVNNFPMPFLMEADEAARLIKRKLAGNRSRIAFPLPLYGPLWFMSCLSTAITDPLFARLPAKPIAEKQ